MSIKRITLGIALILTTQLSNAGLKETLEKAAFEASLNETQRTYRSQSKKAKKSYKKWIESQEIQKELDKYEDREFAKQAFKWSYFREYIQYFQRIEPSLIQSIRGSDNPFWSLPNSQRIGFEGEDIAKEFAKFYGQCFLYKSLKNRDAVTAQLGKGGIDFSSVNSRKKYAPTLNYDYSKVHDHCHKTNLDFFKGEVDTLKKLVNVYNSEIAINGLTSENPSQGAQIAKREMDKISGFGVSIIPESKKKELIKLSKDKAKLDAYLVELEKQVDAILAKQEADKTAANEQHTASTKKYIQHMKDKTAPLITQIPNSKRKMILNDRCMSMYEKPYSEIETDKIEAIYLCSCQVNNLKPDSVSETYYQNLAKINERTKHILMSTNSGEAYFASLLECQGNINSERKKYGLEENFAQF